MQPLHTAAEHTVPPLFPQMPPVMHAAWQNPVHAPFGSLPGVASTQFVPLVTWQPLHVTALQINPVCPCAHVPDWQSVPVVHDCPFARGGWQLPP
jgi:hypothetical protein